MQCVNLQYALILYMFSVVFVFDYASVGERGDATFPWTGESQRRNQFSRHQSKVGSEQTEEWNGRSQGKPENIVNRLKVDCKLKITKSYSNNIIVIAVVVTAVK